MSLPAPPRGLPFELRLALRYLTTTRREGPVAVVTLLCAGGVFTGVLALVLALAFMSGMHGDIRARLLSANSHVEIRPAWGQPSYTAGDVAAVSAIALAHPGVVAAAPYTATWGLLRGQGSERGLPVQVKGIDPVAEDRVTGVAALTSSVGWQQMLAGASGGAAPAEIAPPPASEWEEGGEEAEPMGLAELAPAPAPPILLGEALASELGVSPGDLVHLMSGDIAMLGTGAALRSRALRVVGLVKTGLVEYDQTWALVPLAALTPPGEPLRIEGVELALAQPLEAAEVADALAARLGGKYLVSDWTTTFSRLFAAFRWERLIMAMALGLIGLVAGFNIFTILTLNVTARIADIGILGALGASPATITRVFLWMGLLLGGAGTIAGLGVGAACAMLLDHYRLVALDPSVYLISHVPFRVEIADLVVVALGMLGVSFLATVAPARSAARLDPVVALRSA